MSVHCDTCGRRLTGKRGELRSTDARGNETAWCADHSRHRPPWFGKAGWPWMREYDRLWAKAEALELDDMLKNGGRDLVFDREPPLQEGEVRHFGRLSVHVEWIRQGRPGRWTVRVRRRLTERPLMLRTGSLPFTSTQRGIVSSPRPGEAEQAAIDSAYQSYEDPLDAGEKPPGEVEKYKASVQAKARFIEEQESLAHEEARRKAERYVRAQLRDCLRGLNPQSQALLLGRLKTELEAAAKRQGAYEEEAA